MATAPDFDGKQICLTGDPDIFFPSLHEDPDNPQEGDQAKYVKAVKHAKSLCRECQHVVPCLEYALHCDVDGIWGATTKNERKRLRKELNIPSPKSITLSIYEALR